MKVLHDRNIRFLMYVAVILIVGVGIAYAALSTTLDITFNTVTQNALTWNVAFQTGEVSPTVGGTSSTGRSCGNAIVTADSVTVAATSVSKPGDKCTYELIIENTGTVNARLNAITPTAPSLPTVCQTAAGGVLECNNISYKLTTDAAGTVIYTAGGTIQANHTQTIYLVVSYIPTNTVQSTTDTQTNGKFTLSYMQA